MNTLSLLLYLADIVYTQIAYLMLLTVGVPVVYLFSRLFGLVSADCSYESRGTDLWEKHQKRLSEPFVDNWKFIILPLVVMFFINLIPSRETLYMIIASEAGEQVVYSEDGKKILSDVKEIINLQLESMKSDSKRID